MGALIKRILLAVALAVVAWNAAAADPSLSIEGRSFSKDGALTLDVGYDSPSDVTVYSWRGHVYPLLGFGLTVTATDLEGRALSVESDAKVVPKIPHARDTVTASTYRYPEPLVLRILDKHSRPFRGCADIHLDYDLTKDASGNFRRAGLDLLQLRSNKIRVCNVGE